MIIIILFKKKHKYPWVSQKNSDVSLTPYSKRFTGLSLSFITTGTS